MPSHEPRWLTRPMLLAFQRGRVVDPHQAIVESALAAPRRLYERDPSADLPALAAAYATALANTHGFIAGSKRTAFLAAYVFLGLNGHDMDASEQDVIAAIDSLASRRNDEPGIATWLREVITRIS